MADRHQEDMARIFRALAVDKRRQIVQLLAHRTLCVGALSNLLDVSAGAVSQHLRILKDAGLVEPDRRGYFIHYSLAPDAAARCRAATDSLFQPTTKSKKGSGRCAAGKRSPKRRRT